MLGRGSTKPKEDVSALLKRIDEQNEQIGRLQTKFRDVTQAYKNLLNEKKALEIIVKSVDTKTALTASSRSVSNSDVSEADFHPAESGPNDEDKVHSLTANIQVLLDNKAKMEEAYKAERKKLLSDYEEMRLRYEKYRVECEKKLEVSKSQSQVQEESQNVILLRNENVDLKKKMKNLSKQFENKCEELIQANGELKQLKMAHNEQICGDETKLADMRKLLREANESNERRVWELETRIADLCATIAAHESSLLHANQPSESNTHSRFNENVDFDSAVEQIVYLKKFIETTAKESSINFDFNEIWKQNDELNTKIEKKKLENLELEIERLKNENKHVRDEFEKYKMRTNNTIKSFSKPNQSTPLASSNQELKDQIDVLKKRISLMERDYGEELTDLKQSHQIELDSLKHKFKDQMEHMESERQQQLNQMEKQLVNQRERTLKLISEKDAEIESLKNNKDLNSLLNTDSESDEVAPNRLIYITEANAYKESELARLRKTKADLEYKLKQVCDENCVDVDRLECQIKLLKEEIERLKLNQSRNELNGHNFEYIKNVMYSYLTSKDLNVKMSMINAIMQILKFTKNERHKINQMVKSP